MIKIGTAISQVATPFARVMHLDCIDPKTNDLKPDSPCAKVRDNLDAGNWRSAIYDFIWRKKTTTEEGDKSDMKDWIIIHQLGVQAETYQEAMGMMKDAETISVTIQQRQVMPTRPQGQVETRAQAPGQVGSKPEDKK